MHFSCVDHFFKPLTRLRVCFWSVLKPTTRVRFYRTVRVNVSIERYDQCKISKSTPHVGLTVASQQSGNRKGQIGHRLVTDWTQIGHRMVTEWWQPGHRLVIAGAGGYKVVTKWSHGRKPTQVETVFKRLHCCHNVATPIWTSPHKG